MQQILQTMKVMTCTVRKRLEYAMQQILQTIQVMIRPDSRSASAVGETRLGVSVGENFQVPGMGWSAHNLDSTWHVQPVWEKTNFRFCIFVHTCTSLIIYVSIMQCRLRHCECVFVRQWNEVTHAVTKRFVENNLHTDQWPHRCGSKGLERKPISVFVSQWQWTRSDLKGLH